MEAGNAAKAGILRAHSDAEVVVRPLADGGEGTTDALLEGLGGQKMPGQVQTHFSRFCARCVHLRRQWSHRWHGKTWQVRQSRCFDCCR